MESTMDSQSPIMDKIKNIINEVARRQGIVVDKVILFGSRARGDYREDSDWDLLIILKSRSDRKVVKEFSIQVRRALVDIGIIPEVIIAEKSIVEKYRNYTGYLYHYALTEGIVL